MKKFKKILGYIIIQICYILLLATAGSITGDFKDVKTAILIGLCFEGFVLLVILGTRLIEGEI